MFQNEDDLVTFNHFPIELCNKILNIVGCFKKGLNFKGYDTFPAFYFILRIMIQVTRLHFDIQLKTQFEN